LRHEVSAVGTGDLGVSAQCSMQHVSAQCAMQHVLVQYSMQHYAVGHGRRLCSHHTVQPCSETQGAAGLGARCMAAMDLLDNVKGGAHTWQCTKRSRGAAARHEQGPHETAAHTTVIYRVRVMLCRLLLCSSGCTMRNTVHAVHSACSGVAVDRVGWLLPVDDHRCGGALAGGLHRGPRERQQHAACTQWAGISGCTPACR
jgi:hypothetical protein